MIEVAVEPRSKADQERMGIALSRLAAEDPSFRVGSDPGFLGLLVVIKGMGELHLEIIVDRMKREFKVDVRRRCIPHVSPHDSSGTPSRASSIIAWSRPTGSCAAPGPGVVQRASWAARSVC